MYKLGLYDENGNMNCLRVVGNKTEAKLSYENLREKYTCTIWVQKIEFVNPKEEFAE